MVKTIVFTLKLLVMAPSLYVSSLAVCSIFSLIIKAATHWPCTLWLVLKRFHSLLSLPVRKSDPPCSYVSHLTCTLCNSVFVCGRERERDGGNSPVEEVTARVPLRSLWYIKIYVLTHVGEEAFLLALFTLFLLIANIQQMTSCGGGTEKLTVQLQQATRFDTFRTKQSSHSCICACDLW